MKMTSYNKKCPVCKRIPARFVKIKKVLFFGKEVKEVVTCWRCEGKGIIEPKRVRLKLDEFEPEITY